MEGLDQQSCVKGLFAVFGLIAVDQWFVKAIFLKSRQKLENMEGKGVGGDTNDVKLPALSKRLSTEGLTTAGNIQSRKLCLISTVQN